VNNFKQVQLLQLIEPRLGGEEEEVSEVRRVGVTGLGIGSTSYERVLRNKIAPTELTVLLSRIKWFIDEHSAAVILLDNIDLLILHNNFMQVLNVIRALKDYIKPTKARLIIPIDPLSFSKRELRLLRVELTVI
jgi:adenylosuccinate synthase